MIGEHVVKWEGGQHALKLSTRAMAGIGVHPGLQNGLFGTAS